MYMQLNLSEVIASYKPLRHDELKNIIETIICANNTHKNICFYLGMFWVFLVFTLGSTIYQYYLNNGDSTNIWLALAFVVAVYFFLNYLWGKTESIILFGYRTSFPHIDKMSVSLCLTIEDFDKLYDQEVSDFQYEKLDYLSSKNLLFKNKYKDIMAVRGGKFTKFDYHFMNCEKIYAKSINSTK